MSGSSNAKSLATVLNRLCIQQRKTVRMRAVGAAAVNQAVKGVAIAGRMVNPKHDLVCRPQFETIQMPDGPTSAVVLVVQGS